MFDGWRWSYSRRAELIALATCLIANRLAMSENALELDAFLRSLALYRED